MPVAQGTFLRRWGYTLLNNPGIGSIRRMFNYQNKAAGVRKLVYANTSSVSVSNEDGTGLATIFTPTGGASVPRAVNSQDWEFFTDGIAADAKKWNSVTGLQNWGIATPVTAISVGAPIGAGAITLLNGRNYFVVFKNSITGETSSLSPVSASSGPLTAQNVPLSNIPVSADSQVDKKELLATLDGGNQTVLYFLAEINNATTTYTDLTSDATLATQAIYLETDDNGIEHGVADNFPPPAGLDFIVKHKGRIVGAVGSVLWFTKNLEEVTTSTGTVTGKYESCWPPTNTIDVGPEAETIKGLLSDGNTLYIATERYIRRLDGDGPLNYSKPEAIFNEVGVLAQDSWKVVFAQGQPVGMAWLTPDYRVISSNFQSYQDIGTPIQNVLNSINPAATANIWGGFFSKNAFDVYILAIPTGLNTDPDTLCVYDLRGSKWFIWTPTDPLTAGLFNINATGTSQWLIASQFSFVPSSHGGKVYFFDPTTTQDRVGDTPVGFTVSLKTAWMHLGEPTARKALNEMEIITGDPSLTLTVEGASTSAQALTSPNSVVSNASLVTGPRGDFKVYLAGKAAKDRHYRFTFTSTGTATDILQGYTVEAARLYAF